MDEVLDTNAPVVEQPVPENQPEQTPEQTTTPQPSQYEVDAREMGWRPKEEWEGDPDKWRDAKEFVERGELYGKIDTLGRDLKETRKALKMLQEHHAKVKETEFAKAVQELKALQKQHLEAGDSDKYLETTELLTDLKAEQKAREVIQDVTPKQPDPRFVSWVDQNKWYSNDQEMRRYADTIGLGYANANPGIDPTEVLSYVTQEVKVRFKDKFVNPNRNKPSAVEGQGSNAPSKKSDSFEMTEEERKVMNTFIRSNIMSKEDYIKELKLMKGVK